MLTYLEIVVYMPFPFISRIPVAGAPWGWLA